MNKLLFCMPFILLLAGCQQNESQAPALSWTQYKGSTLDEAGRATLFELSQDSQGRQLLTRWDERDNQQSYAPDEQESAELSFAQGEYQCRAGQERVDCRSPQGEFTLYPLAEGASVDPLPWVGEYSAVSGGEHYRLSLNERGGLTLASDRCQSTGSWQAGQGATSGRYQFSEDGCGVDGLSGPLELATEHGQLISLTLQSPHEALPVTWLKEDGPSGVTGS
ncbi:hypothetical protein [Aeromonas sp. BIGb0445]|jgi:hypothetical protein|uniref:hypothetical protein n=1 Tax=Aeromonas sp. BIGb0445 TaxID=2940593 RepID=UPI0021682A89|nr:hypothetical protein [Aeromonas sp. BIGb0445]MCS3461336.1 hypothetical protein [Aeromonas sp. BIGb0445]